MNTNIKEIKQIYALIHAGPLGFCHVYLRTLPLKLIAQHRLAVTHNKNCLFKDNHCVTSLTLSQTVTPVDFSEFSAK